MNQNSKRSIISSAVIALLIMCAAFTTANAQSMTGDKFGKGLRMMAADSSFAVKFSARMQNRYEGTYVEEGDPSYVEKMFLRRARFKFDGFAFSPKLVYKIEYDAVNAEILDAVVKWNFVGNWNLWVGQTKLPGNRERVISSQKLQFVDRSELNSKFTIDRDKGIQLRTHYNMGAMLVRHMGSISVGEGKNFSGTSKGRDYTYRLEMLPFGKFNGKGDYFGADLKREEDPKLALGFTYDYNDNSVKERGQKGAFLSESRDLKTIFADMMFKYRGLSLMVEYANRVVSNDSVMIYEREDDGSFAIDDKGDRVVEGGFYTGSSLNASAGYLFLNNWELAGRYTEVRPESLTGNADIIDYTLGLSKYIVGHNLKVQGDLTLRNEGGEEDKVIFRLQLEVAL